jgi:hypothetical protein
LQKKKQMLLDRPVDVADAVDDVEEPPVVLLRPREGLLFADEGRGSLGGVRRDPELRRAARAPAAESDWIRLQRCSGK